MTALTLDAPATDEWGNLIVLDGCGNELVIIEPLSAVDIARYVSTQPEIARARAVLVETYRRLTDFATPPRVVREIAGPLDALACWLSPEAAG